MKQTWIAQDDDAKKRLDVFITEHIDGLSRSQAQKRIEGGSITLNGKQTDVHHFLKAGDEITYDTDIQTMRTDSDAEDPESMEEVPTATISKDDLRIIKETSDWIIVYKPCGVLMHPDHDHENGTLIDAVVAHAPNIAKIGEDPSRPGIVSRLDKDVSGLVVIAKTQDAFDHLKNQFAQHTVQKIYTALVYGEMEQEEGDIRFRIARSTSKARMSAIPEGSDAGQAAWTHYETIERYRDASLLKLEIMTGRTHQIRAHLYAIQHPIVGDILYKPKNIKRSVETPRLMLQSTLLAFDDPSSGERIRFELPLDDDFANVLAELQKVAK